MAANLGTPVATLAAVTVLWLLNVAVLTGADDGVTISATCDNKMTLYVDGQVVAKDNNWRHTSKFKVDRMPQVVGIECVDNGGVGGILGSISSGVITDSSWRCSTWGPDGWASPGFDDSSWGLAHETRGHGGRRPGIHKLAKWIWTGKHTWRGVDKHVFCRKTFPKPDSTTATTTTTTPTTKHVSSSVQSSPVETEPPRRIGLAADLFDDDDIDDILKDIGDLSDDDSLDVPSNLDGIIASLKAETQPKAPNSTPSPLDDIFEALYPTPEAPFIVNATCDNIMTIFADGRQVANNSDWRKTTTVQMAANTSVLAIECRDLYLVGGLVASTSSGVITDEHWLCSHEFEDGWTGPDFDDSDWHHAQQIGQHGMSPWFHRPGISSDAYWIWTQGCSWMGGRRHVYCRRHLTV